MSVVERFAAEFARVEAELPGAALPGCAARRRRALERFGALGLPNTRQEGWRHTPLTLVERREWRALSGAGGRPSAPPLGLLGDRWLFVDGVAAGSPHPALPAGARVVPFAEAGEADLDALLDAGTGDDPSSDGLEALNAAFAHCGVLLELAPGTVLEAPIEFHFHSTAAAGRASLQPRIALRLGAGASATVVMHHSGDADATGFCNVHSVVTLARGARLRHCTLQDAGTSACHVERLVLRTEAEAEAHLTSLVLGGALSRHEVDVALIGPGANVTLDGLWALAGRQHGDHHVRIAHEAPRTSSRQHFLGLHSDASHGVFRGAVRVAPGAPGSAAHQTNRNLLLSLQAEVDTRPELEIEIDEVQASHGATVGQLDDTALFYLRSRGIDAAVARAMLCRAFAAGVLDAIEIPALREHATQRLVERIPDHAREEPAP